MYSDAMGYMSNQRMRRMRKKLYALLHKLQKPQCITIYFLGMILLGLFLLGGRKLYVKGTQMEVILEYIPKLAMESRKERVQNVCEELDPKGTLKSSRMAFSSNHLFKMIIVSDKYKFLYCEVPKVACTSWKTILGFLNGMLNSTDTTGSVEDVHLLNFKYLSSFKPEEIEYRLNSYKKFMFVRHPFERLVSAYRNKLVKYNTFYFNLVGKRIIRLLRKNPTREEKKYGTGVLFYEFVKWLVQYESSVLNDDHWSTYNDLCHPCSIDYDYIGKHESMKDDSEYILNQILPRDVKSKIHLPIRNAHKMDTSRLVDKYFKNVTYADLIKIWGKYALDFDMFRYDLDTNLTNNYISSVKYTPYKYSVPKKEITKIYSKH